MLGAILVMGALGVVLGAVLALASKIFYVHVDPKIEVIEDALPGANCGGCGLPGCKSNAEAIAAGKSPVSSCVIGGPDVTAEIAKAMGVEVQLKEPEIARSGCGYGVQDADVKYLYQGIKDCRAANLQDGGAKTCPIGCLGLGTCARACPFGAISMGADNLPVVNNRRCTGCGTCERVCPKHIITLSSKSDRIIGEYVTGECTAPCMRSCPTGINIPAFIGEIRKHNHGAALAIIKEKCPLPLICGYICPAPCELSCRRNLMDEPVAINPLKRFVADHGMETGKQSAPYKAPGSGRKIALVGGGAEGLTVGYYLARLGYHPTIFEAKPELGGILRYVIAEDRLPRKVLDHEIEGILEAGVEAKTNMTMGKDFHLESLFREGFDAIALTNGGFDSRQILQSDNGGPYTPLNGVFTMLDFMSFMSEGKGLDLDRRRIAIIHNGLEGLSLARRCMDMGAMKVSILSNSAARELPIELQDFKRLADEEIFVAPSTIVTGLRGISGRLIRAAYEDPHPVPGMVKENGTIRTDLLVIPTGRIPELVFVPGENQPAPREDEVPWETMETFRTFPGRNDGICTSPEPGRISDSSAVVKSLLSGRRLTRAIHQYFTGNSITPIEALACENDAILDVTEIHDVAASHRERPETQDVEGDSKTAWIFPGEYPGLDEASAAKEAERCLRCGLICYKRGENA